MACFLSLPEPLVGIASSANGVVGSSKCKINCDTDADCPGLEHCCSNGCGAQCSMPVIEGKFNSPDLGHVDIVPKEMVWEMKLDLADFLLNLLNYGKCRTPNNDELRHSSLFLFMCTQTSSNLLSFHNH